MEYNFFILRAEKSIVKKQSNFTESISALLKRVKLKGILYEKKI